MGQVELFCPIDHVRLTAQSGTALSCKLGHAYPIVDGVPVLLRDDVDQTMKIALASIARGRNVKGSIDERNPSLYLESLGVGEHEKRLALDLATRGSKIDPVVCAIIGATNGIAYMHLIGREFQYPIPDIRLPRAKDELFLDIGCNWGRWSIAAARNGYRVVGIDPSLGAIMAARRVARELNLEIDYICADGRHLPFDADTFHTVFSFSVIQHFNKTDAAQTLKEIGRVLKPFGNSLIQMPNWLGLRSLQHQWRRRFVEGSGFDVRYWSISELRQTFERFIGRSEISVHCYFGLGLEPSDVHLMRCKARVAVKISELLRKLSFKVPPLVNFADSVYVASTKETSWNV